MKNSQLSTLNFQLILVLLFFTASCNFTGNSDKTQTQSIAVPDSLFVPTGYAKLDSLLLLAATYEQDTNLVRLYYKIGDMYESNDYEKAKEYYLKVKSLSEKLDWNEGRYLFANGYTNILNHQGFFDSSIVIHQQALELTSKETNELRNAKILTNIGTCYAYKRWYTTALEYYNKAIPVFEKNGDKPLLSYLYCFMGYIYGEIGMRDEHLAFCEKGVDLFNETPDILTRVTPLCNYGRALIFKGRNDEAEKCFLDALRICSLHNNKSYLSNIYCNLSFLALEVLDMDKTEKYAKKALETAIYFEDVEGCSNAYRMYADVEMARRNYDKSEEYSRNALKVTDEYELPIEAMSCYRQLSALAMARHDFHNQRMYENKADSIQNALMSEKTIIYAKEMEAKYETEKKELKISALEAEKRLVIWLSIFSVLVLLLALAAFFFLWRWTVQKRQHAETRIKQFEQEKQLVATQAVLDGETAERTRLARDLHDGLGGKLTGLKLRLQGLQNNTESEQYKYAMDLLDESVREMRRVSYNLMPDTLINFGLKQAVSDFCHSMSSNIIFNYYGAETRLDPKLELLVYRCIHELVNNALKYSDASKIMVQIIQEAGSIGFNVQDNGCGFDPLSETQGTGLKNVRSRVASYNGIIDISSKQGEGTEVNVELKIKK